MRTSLEILLGLVGDTDTTPYTESIPAILGANLLAWWDANRDLYSDAGTTPAADGTGVQQWNDQGSNSYHVSQGTAGDRPLYRASVAAFGGKPGVQFVSSDFLIRTGLSAGLVANKNIYNIFVVFVTSSGGVEYFYGEGNSGVATQFVGIRHNNNLAAILHRDDASTTATAEGGTTAASGAAHLMTARRIASNSWSIRLDGAQQGTSTTAPTTTSNNQIALGCLPRTTNSLFFIGHLAQVLVADSDQYAAIEPILAAEYGIALP